MKILIVDDLPTAAQKLREAFTSGEEIIESRDLMEAVAVLSEADFWPDLVILDAYFPQQPESSPEFMSGEFLDAMEEICDFKGTDLPDVILVSGHGETATKFNVVSTWLDAGRIRDILPKNVADAGWEIFQAILRHKVEVLRRERELRQATKTNEGALAWLATCGIHTGDMRMAKVWDRICQATVTGHNVFIQGESGTGKELVAKAIAAISKRKLVSKNCSAIPSELFESEIFGTVRGAFNDARDRKGWVEEAKDGCLFLDEVCKLLPHHQTALLLVVDDNREFSRVGDTKIQKATCQFVFADSFPLWERVDNKEFSEELANRIANIIIQLPPLRERRSGQQSDIRLLTSLFLERENQTSNKRVRLTEEVYRVFENGPWPGNVRALSQIIANIVTHPNNDGMVTLEGVRKSFDDPQRLARETGLRSSPAESGARTISGLPPAALTDPQRLLAVLKMELSHPTPGTWVALGRKDKEEDAEHEHESLILTVLKLVLNDCGQEMLKNLQSTLKARGKNDPRRVNLYKSLLYLALHPKHAASLNDFGKITDLNSWVSRNKLAESLVRDFRQLSPHVSQPVEEEKNSMIKEDTSGNHKVYRLSTAVMQ
jgi:DNA-binding NtrC family response regulator